MHISRAAPTPASAAVSYEEEDQANSTAASTQEPDRFVCPNQQLRVPPNLAQSSHQAAQIATLTCNKLKVQQYQSELGRGTPQTDSTVKNSGSVIKVPSLKDFLMETNESVELAVGKQCDAESTEKSEICKQQGDIETGNTDCEKTDSGSSQSAWPVSESKNASIPLNSLDTDGVEEKDDSSEPHSSLLPTPVMPQNWFDPSRKYFDSDVNFSAEEADSSDIPLKSVNQGYALQNKDYVSDEIEERRNNEKTSVHLQENELQITPMAPEKICSPLLPTPVMPENWLDPCRKSTDSSFPVSLVRDTKSQFLQPGIDCANLPPTSFDDHFISSSSSCNSFEGLSYPQTPFLHPSDTDRHSQNNSSFDGVGQEYGNNNSQPLQERNFKAKHNTGWNKQTRQTQPYYRPQSQTSYGMNSYSLQPIDRSGFQTNISGTLNTSPGYIHNMQSASERRQQVYQWKN